MFDIINFTDNQYFEMGLKYITPQTYKFKRKTFLVLIGQDYPMSALLHLSKIEAGSRVIIISDNLCPRFVSSITGNHFNIEVVPECISPEKLLSLLSLPFLQLLNRKPTHFSKRELYLIMEFKKNQSNSLSLIAKNSNLNVKTISTHKRNILKKIGSKNSAFLFKMLNDPNFDKCLNFISNYAISNIFTSMHK